MATKIELNKVYKSASSILASTSIQVIGGTVTIFGSNVTEYITDPKTKKVKLKKPTFDSLVVTDEELAEGIHLISGLPEWVGFKGTASEVWVKMGINPRVE